MKSLEFLRRLSKRRVLLIRRVAGGSMLPGLRPGQLLVAVGWFMRPVVGDVVIISHNGLEKVKRVQKRRPDSVYIVGDNPVASTDSRDFGWIDAHCVIAKVIWPRLNSVIDCKPHEASL